MRPDTTDLLLVFAFILCVIVIAGVSGIRTAYRAGYFHGKQYGILSERERRRGVEQRVSEAIEETFKSEKWDKELDV